MISEQTLSVADKETWDLVQDKILQLIEEADSLPDTVEVRETVRISGFSLPDEVREIVVENKPLEESQRLLALRDKQRAFRLQLQSVGFSPLAVFPEELWASLCKRFNLFRFEHMDAEGKVDADMENLENLSDGLLGFLPSILLYFIAIALWHSSVIVTGTLTILCVLSFFHFNNLYKESDILDLKYGKGLSLLAVLLTWSYPLVASFLFLALAGGLTVASIPDIFFACLIGFFGTCLLYFVYVKAVDGSRFERMVLKKLVRHTPKRKIVELLWPDHIDECISRSQSIRVTFPDPPEDVATVLKRAREADIKLNVAAEPAAIDISHEDVFAGVVRDKQLHDPIIYVKDGECVAIIAQFGNFPEEKAVIEHIRNSDWFA